MSPKFQVVIPEKVRNALGLKAGSQVDVIAKGKVAYIVPLGSLEELQKSLSPKLDSKSLREKKDRKV